MAHELAEEGLVAFAPWTAAATTELTISGVVQYLAFWRLDVQVTALADYAWERLRRVAAPEEPQLYVPAFSLRRSVMQLLGQGLTEAQPLLELEEGLPSGAGFFSPVVIGREDARILSHFVYLAYEAEESKGLRSVDYELAVKREELVFVPALPDPRQIRTASWRLLLREFDDLVA